jgi:hypothetical protein
MGEVDLGHPPAAQYLAEFVPPAEATRLFHVSSPLRLVQDLRPLGGPVQGSPALAYGTCRAGARRSWVVGRYPTGIASVLVRRLFRGMPPLVCMTCVHPARLRRSG